LDVRASSQWELAAVGDSTGLSRIDLKAATYCAVPADVSRPGRPLRLETKPPSRSDDLVEEFPETGSPVDLACASVSSLRCEKSNAGGLSNMAAGRLQIAGSDRVRAGQRDRVHIPLAI
jgi:hypothetical protein